MTLTMMTYTVFGYLFLFSGLLCLGTWPDFLRLASTVTSGKERSDVINAESNGQQNQRRNESCLPRLSFFLLHSLFIPLLVEKIIPRRNNWKMQATTFTAIWIGFCIPGWRPPKYWKFDVLVRKCGVQSPAYNDCCDPGGFVRMYWDLAQCSLGTTL